jgi:hypothetical protein
MGLRKKKSKTKPTMTSPKKVPSDGLGGMGNLKKIGYNALLPMALGSWDRRTIHQARLIKVDKRSILSVTSTIR